MDGKEIRKKFLDYFRDREHEIVKSSSLIPKDDPTLLFTNAGMVQFKNLFLGIEKAPYKRAATSQKCIRAGGKHNDLEQVGYTNRHHTFFEMLGNFSFGDYFKKEAIAMAWELLTGVYGLPKDRLWISVYKDDEESREVWLSDIGLPEERVKKFGEEDNFWSMGETGPCGPCSEIYFDQGPGAGCGNPTCSVGCDCDRYLEIWNLVFTQFNRESNGDLKPLPRPNIDTGMGLERLAAVLQGVYSNYDSDLFSYLIKSIEGLSGSKYGQDEKRDTPFKVIADHSRATAFLIADGILPSNEGRGYVLRRIIRRAVRYGQALGLEGAFLNLLAEKVVDEMGAIYPELSQSKRFINEVVINEEKRFADTLFHGLSLLRREIEEIRDKGQAVIPGDLVFRLYDTFGFPPDLVNDIARDENLQVDMKGFDKAMSEQKAASQRSWKGSGEEEIPEIYRKLDARGLGSGFLGYETLESRGKVLAILKDGQEVDTAKEGEEIGLLLDQTPFYSESGGQVGDTGIIKKDGMEMEVVDTLSYPSNIIVHKAKVARGDVSKGDTVEALVHNTRRTNIASNHTATHLLQSALREILGDHVKQSGSHVGPERLRFDFTHFSQIAPDALKEIEMRVNRNIQSNLPVKTQTMSREDAFNLDAMALFEERYGDEVRVVSIGKGLSAELCGGTHVDFTGDIGVFLVVSEGAVAAGIRRIEALTGEPAIREIQSEKDSLIKISEFLKTTPHNLVTRVEYLLEEQKEKERQIESLKSRLATKRSEDMLESFREIEGVKVISQEVQSDNPRDMRNLGDQLKDRIKSGIIILAAGSDEKAFLLCRVTQDLTDVFDAGKIIKELAPLVGGKGGGRKDMAEGGGSKPSEIKTALSRAYEVISSQAKAAEK